MSKNTGTSELINYFDLGANGDVGIAGSLDINTIANATTDTDTFLVSDNGIIKYRTGAELLSDIGVAGNYVTIDTAQTITGIKTFSGTNLQLESSGSADATILRNTSGVTGSTSNSNTIGFNGVNNIFVSTQNRGGFILGFNNSVQNREYTLPDASGTIALTSSIPANPVGGTGTTNYLPKFTGTSTIGNSSILDNGTGRVSIGTTSFLDSFVISNSGTTGWEFSNNGSVITYNRSTAAYIPMTFEASNYILNRGNLGLGVTPSAWSGGFLGFDIGGSSASVISSSSRNIIASNLFYNGASYIYKNSDFALMHWLDRPTGQYRWYTAPSGTAGAAISFTQAMTLTSSSNLLVGTSSDNGARLQVSGTGRFTDIVTVISSSSTGYVAQTTANSVYPYFRWIANNRSYWAAAIDFGTDATFKIGGGNTIGSSPFLTIDSGTNSSTFTTTLAVTGSATFSSSVTAGAATVSSSGLLSIAVGNSVGGAVKVQDTDGGGTIEMQASGGLTYFGSTSNHNVLFIANNSPVMVLNTSGSVGIGTTSPTSITGFTTLSVNNSTFGGIIETMYNNTPYGRFFTNANFYVGLLSVQNVPLILGTNDTERMRITSSGNVLIGTTTDNGAKLNVDGFVTINGAALNYPLNVEAGTGGIQISLTRVGANSQMFMGGDTGAGTQFFIRSNGSGGVRLDSGATAWVSASDMRLKNIEKPIENAVQSLLALQTVYYSWKDSEDKSLHLGLIAQEVEAVFPEIVSKSSIDEMKGVNYTELIPVLIQSIKELKQEIDTLKN